MINWTHCKTFLLVFYLTNSIRILTSLLQLPIHANCSSAIMEAHHILTMTNCGANIVSMLDDFLFQPHQFFKLLHANDAVVTGEFMVWLALKTLTPTPPSWKPTQLDICMPKNTFVSFRNAFAHLKPVVRTDIDTVTACWKSNRTSFLIQPNIKPHTGAITTMTNSLININLIASSCDNVLLLIFSQWGSHHLNAMTHDKLILSYPALTLASQAIVFFTDLRFDEIDVLASNIDYGFSFWYEHGKHPNVDMFACDEPPTCPSTKRWIGDQHCLTIDLSQTLDDTVGALSPMKGSSDLK